ncbi:MAG: hypothetical protein IJ244_01930 [Bacteroidaceae bacterium]|nr:hypothetical protein [Bacteroidaceae bacterium]
METQTNHNTIPVNEMDDLREQIALFKQRLNQQEIINDRLMRHSMNARLGIFTKASVIIDVIGLFLTPIIFVALHRIGIPWYFGIVVPLMVIAELAYNISSHRLLQRLFAVGTDLVSVRRGLLRFKRTERLWMLISVPLILLWMLAFYWQMGLFSGELTGKSAAGIVMSAMGIFFGLLFCFIFFAWEMHRVNHSIREIDELSRE